MDIHFMRRLDRWLGVPLCFLLSIVRRIQDALFPKSNTDEKHAQKILFIKLSEMGAIVLAYPLLKFVRQQYPKAQLYFLIFEKNRAALDILGSIIPAENIITIRDGSFGMFLGDSWKAARRLRKEHISISFDLEMLSRFSACIAYVIGATKRIGFSSYTFEGHYRGTLLTHAIQFNPLLHISKSYVSLGKAAVDPLKKTPEFSETIEDQETVLPAYQSRPIAKQAIQQLLQSHGIIGQNNMVVISPGEGTLPLRDWPLEHFVELSRLLLVQPDTRIVLIGSPSVANKTTLLFEALPPEKCLDLTGKTSLPELMELFLLADAFVSNDCGLAHFASLTPIEKFVIFGPESPLVFSPLGESAHVLYADFPCSPCFSIFNHRNSACRSNNCVRAIKPLAVAELVRATLAEKGKVIQ